MKHIQEAVKAYLEHATGIPAVSARTHMPVKYPMLAVEVQKEGTVLLAGGKLAEHSYQVTVTAADSREREHAAALLSSLWAPLLRGIPMEQNGESRILHPLNISAQGDTMTFSLELCVPLPLLPDTQNAEAMEALHFGI